MARRREVRWRARRPAVVNISTSLGTKMGDIVEEGVGSDVIEEMLVSDGIEKGVTWVNEVGKEETVTS